MRPWTYIVIIFQVKRESMDQQRKEKIMKQHIGKKKRGNLENIVKILQKKIVEIHGKGEL